MITKKDWIRVVLPEAAQKVVLTTIKERFENNQKFINGPTNNETPELALERLKLGVPCEAAVYQAFRPCYWDRFTPGRPAASKADIDDFIDVKGIRKLAHQLALPKVNEPFAYLLVLKTDWIFDLIGWAWGHEIGIEANRTQLKPGRNSHVVSQNHPILKPPRDLLAILRDRQAARIGKPIYRCAVCNGYATQTLAIHNPNQKPLPPISERLWYCYDHLPRSPDAKPNPAVATA